MNALQPSKAATKTATPATEATPEPQAEIQIDTDALIQAIESIRVPAKLNGHVMDLTFGPGTNPMLIAPGLKAMDPNVVFKTEFFTKGFGKKDTKTATCLVLTARVTDNGAFIDLTCQNGDDISVAVSKKKAPEFPATLAALGRLSDDHIAKIQKAYDDKGTATIVLSGPERFGVLYWTTDDGKHFLDSLTPEPPAPEPKPEKKA